MHRFARNARATVAATALLAAGASIGAPAASAAAPSAQDKTFMGAAAQTNLAEITLGGIVKPKTSNDQTIEVANKTVSDHTTAQSQLTALAKQKGVTLPSAPNATQQAGAAKVSAADASTVDLTYGQVQVQGHQAALADIDKELSSGSDADTKAFATAQRPIVAMHLQMAQSLVAATSGTPSGVPAGTGGQAAAQQDATPWLTTTLWIAGGLLVVLVLAIATRRRSSVRTRD